MISTEHVTKRGVRLEIGRIPRQQIDDFTLRYVPPEPPVREVEAFGGITEEMPILDDPAYLERLLAYYVRLGDEQIELIASAVRIVGPRSEALLAELEDLRKLDLAEEDDWPAHLRFSVLADDEEMGTVVGLVFYNSTVTEKGIAEASRAMAVTWMGQPVEGWRMPGTPGRYGQLFEARRAARYSEYTWEGFCGSTGPEQSAAVAFYRLSTKLDWLTSQE